MNAFQALMLSLRVTIPEGEISSKPLGSFQSLRFGQFGLTFVEGPEAVGFEFQSASDVQTVEGPHGKRVSKLTGEVYAKIEGVFGHGFLLKQAGSFIQGELGNNSLCSLRRHRAPKLMLP